MKYFDAQKRKKVYLNTENVKELKLNIESGQYLDVPIEDRLDIFLDLMRDADFKDFAAVQIEITVNDTDEDMLDDTAIFEVMSNMAVAYARSFPYPKEKVASPTKALLEKMAISPMSVVALTMTQVVDKPVQIVVHRHHKDSDSYEKVELAW